MFTCFHNLLFWNHCNCYCYWLNKLRQGSTLSLLKAVWDWKLTPPKLSLLKSFSLSQTSPHPHDPKWSFDYPLFQKDHGIKSEGLFLTKFVISNHLTLGFVYDKCWLSLFFLYNTLIVSHNPPSLLPLWSCVIFYDLLVTPPQTRKKF